MATAHPETPCGRPADISRLPGCIAHLYLPKNEFTAAIFEVSFNGGSISINRTNFQSLITVTMENVLQKR